MVEIKLQVHRQECLCHRLVEPPSWRQECQPARSTRRQGRHISQAPGNAAGGRV